MTAPASRRAVWLLRWYPPDWRARYGAEFTELLIADLTERPRSARRTADIAAAGARARLASAGLTRHGLGADPNAGPALATAAVAAGVIAILGLAQASQLGIGMQWLGSLTSSVPGTDRAGLSLAMIAMSCALAGFALLVLAGTVPLVRAAVVACRAGRVTQLRWPVMVISAAVTLLVVGGRHFENGWPGTGSHFWFGRGMAGVAAFGWATTSWFTSWWVHPGLLAATPPAEIGWQMTSLAGWIALLGGVWRLLRVLASGRKAAAYGRSLSRLAGCCWAGFGLGMILWLACAPPAPAGPIHFGLVNLSGMGAILLALAAGLAASRQALRADRLGRSR